MPATRPGHWLRIILLSLAVLTPSRAADPGRLDPAFPSGPGPSGPVWALSVLDQDHLLIGGEFDRVGDVPRPGLARLRSDGSLDAGFQPDVPPDTGTIWGAEMLPDGRVLAGGRHLFRLQPDGRRDPTFAPYPLGAGFAAFPDGSALVWEWKLSRLLPDGTTDPAFTGRVALVNAFGSESIFDVSIVKILALTDGRAVAVGYFNRVNGERSEGLERLTPSGARDPGFTPGRGNSSDTDIALDAKGRLQVVDGAPAIPQFRRLLPDGTPDAYGVGVRFENPSVPGAEPAVSRILPEPSGKLIVAGGFETVDGVPRRHLARLNEDGTLDPTFDAGTGVEGPRPLPLNQRFRRVHRLARQSSGGIVMAGSFERVQGVARPYLARLNGGESRVAPTITAPPQSLVVDEGQPFSFSVGATSFEPPRYQWWRDGTPIPGATNATLSRSTAVVADAGTYAVEVLNAAGTTRSPGATLQVRPSPAPAVTIQAGPRTWVTGDTLTLTAVSAGVPPPTFQWQFESLDIPGATRETLSIENIQSRHAGRYRVVARSAAGTAVSAEAALTVTPETRLPGRLDTSLHLSSLDGGTVRTLAFDPQHRIFLGGNLGDGRLPRVIRVLPDGTADPAFDPASRPTDGTTICCFGNSPLTTSVQALALQPDGRIVVAGNFTAYGARPASGFARLLPDGGVDATFQTAPGLSGGGWPEGDVLAFVTGGRILVGGTFTGIHGTPRGRLARLESDGRLDASFGVENGAAEGSIRNTGRLIPYDWTSVRRIQPLPDGRLLVAGDFTRYGGLPRTNLARLSADGRVDPTFQIPLEGDPPGTPTDLLPLPDGRLLVALVSARLNGVFHVATVARYRADGTWDPTYRPPRFDAVETGWLAIQRLLRDASDRVYVAGIFKVLGENRTVESVVRLLPDGTLDPSWGPPSGPNAPIETLALAANGDLVVGGAFNRFAGVPRNGLARLYGDRAGPPRLDPPRVLDGHLRFTFETLAGATYRLESRDLVGAGVWTALYGSVTGNGSPATLDAPLPSGGRGFYRVRRD